MFTCVLVISPANLLHSFKIYLRTHKMFLNMSSYSLQFPTSVAFFVIALIDGPFETIKTKTEPIEDQADDLLAEGGYERAIPFYDEIINQSPTAKLYGSRGLCNWNLRRLDAAIADFEQALKLDPRNVENRYFLALSQFHSEKFTQALASCQQALTDGPTLEEKSQLILLKDQSISKIKREMLKDGLKDKMLPIIQEHEEDEDDKEPEENSSATQEQFAKYERKEGGTVTLPPKLVSQEFYEKESVSHGIYKKGTEFYNHQKYNEALQYYDDAINLNPTVSEYYVGRGMCHNQLRKIDLALKDYKKVLELEPYNARCRILLAQTLMDIKGEFLEALQNLEQVLKKEDLPLHEREVAASMKEKALHAMQKGEEVLIKDDYVNPFADQSNTNDVYEDVKAFDISEQLYQKALVAFGEDKYHEAIEFMNQAIEVNSEQPQLYLYRGIMNWILQEVELAIVNYEQSLELDPSNVRCRIYLAQALYDFEEFDGALEQLHRAKRTESITPDELIEVNSLIQDNQLKLNRDPVENYYWPEQGARPGHIVIKTDGDTDQARSERNTPTKKDEAAETVEKTDKDLNREACRLFENRKYDEALLRLDEAIRKNQREPRYYRNRATIFEELKQYNFAIANYQQAVDLDPNYIHGRLLLAQALIESEKFHQALNHLQQVLGITHITSEDKVKAETLRYEARQKLDQKVTNRWLQEGDQNMLEETQNTETDPEKSGSENPCMDDKKKENKEAWPSPHSTNELNSRGNVFFSQNEFEKALECYTSAIERNEREAMYRRNRGACFLELGQLESAIKDLEESLKLDPHCPRGLYLLGQALYDSDKSGLAMEYLEEALMCDDHQLDEKKRILITELLKKVVRKADEEAAKQKSRKGKQIIVEE